MLFFRTSSLESVKLTARVLMKAAGPFILPSASNAQPRTVGSSDSVALRRASSASEDEGHTERASAASCIWVEVPRAES